MNVLKQILLVTCSMLLAMSSIAIANSTYDDGSSNRYTIESAFYRITQLPSSSRQGRIAVYDSLEDQLSNCRACAKLLYLSPNTQIRVAQEGSMYSVEDVADLPPQIVYLVVDDGVVVKIGFSELELSDIDAEL